MRNGNMRRMLTAFVLTACAVLLAGCGGPKEGDVDAESQKYLPVKVTYIDNGDVNQVREYTYNEQGDPVTCSKTEAASVLEDTYDNTYREDGTLEKVVVTRQFDPEENGKIETDQVVLEYSDQGKLVRKQDENWTELYAYNENGQKIRHESLPDGKDTYKTIREYKYKEETGELSQTVEIWQTAYDEGKAGAKDLDCTVSYSANGYITHIQYPEDADGFPYWDYKYENKDGLITKITYYYEGDVYEYQLEYDTSNASTKVSEERYIDYINTIE